jgi:uncharacterized protein (DUF4415 family)
MSKKHTLEKFGTDIERLKNMKDEDIDFSDIPKTTPEMWTKGFVRKGLKPVKNKKQITLRIDQDVLDFFKEQGKGYQTKINQLLRTYMEEVQKQS